jgi:hypothetical protein
MMIPGENNSILVYQSSLSVLPAETSGASGRNGRRNENFAYSVSSVAVSKRRSAEVRVRVRVSLYGICVG